MMLGQVVPVGILKDKFADHLKRIKSDYAPLKLEPKIQMVMLLEHIKYV